MRPVSVRNEEGEQIAVCDWLRWHKLVFLHVPNEAKRSQAAGHLQKLMGLQKGFPDLLVLEPRGRYHGLAIEMKAIGGRVRPEQKEWIETLKAKDYAAEIAYGADHAIALIEEYIRTGYDEQRSTAKWTNVNDFENMYIGECSNCKDTVWIYKDDKRRWKYCPNCGAKMDEEEE